MKLKRWMALPIAGLAAIAIGVAAVQAAPSPSASGAKNYGQVFVDKLAAILGLSPSKTQDALKQAQLQTVDQMLADGKITKAQADAIKARINAGQGLAPFAGPGIRKAPLGGASLMRDLKTAEQNALASALHLSQADLQQALRSGKSLSDLESQQKVSDSAVKTALKNAAKGVLDKAVKAGTITQAQADTILSRVGTGKLGQLGHGLKPRGVKPSQSPAATPAAYFSTI